MRGRVGIEVDGQEPLIREQRRIKRAWSLGEDKGAWQSFALAECNANARKATQEGRADILSAGLREQDPRELCIVNE